MAQAATKAAPEQRERPSPEQQEAMRKRRGIELALARIDNDLKNSTSERHRTMLEAAKAELQRQLSEL